MNWFKLECTTCAFVTALQLTVRYEMSVIIIIIIIIINRLQQIQNSFARAVVKAPKSTHITPILKSLHWLKVNERIEYKLFSLTYKVLTTAQPSYLRNIISLQPPRSTRSSSVVTLSRPQPSPQWRRNVSQWDGSSRPTFKSGTAHNAFCRPTF